LSSVSTELAVRLGQSPALLPHAFDVAHDRVIFVEMTRGDYQQASFLDARLLAAGALRESFAWHDVTDAIEAAPLRERCGFIFHIGHVGSTLLSRLMGAHARVFALREPLVLRTFALLAAERDNTIWSKEEIDARLTGCLALLSRTFEESQLAVIKATSFVSELASVLLARAAAPRALIMYVAPESYLATIMGGPNSREEARILTPQRLRRLQRRIGSDAWPRAALSEGESVALGWACEMSALAPAARAAGARARRVDFENFLAAPAEVLHAALAHFAIDATPGELRTILEGPDVHRYAKAPEHAYDARLRDEILNEARATHAAEIRRGLQWLERAAREFEAVRDALEFAAAGARETG
jgi:hypothetical protein